MPVSPALRAPVHAFRGVTGKLPLSQDPGVREWLGVCYDRLFHPLVDRAYHDHDLGVQQQGHDVSLRRLGGQIVTGDEKIRLYDYGDLILEYLSNNRTGALGWWCKPGYCPDFIFYAVLPAECLYRIPYPPLRRIWEQFGDSYLRGLPHVPAANNGYTTRSLAFLPAYLQQELGLVVREPGEAKIDRVCLPTERYFSLAALRDQYGLRP